MGDCGGENGRGRFARCGDDAERFLGHAVKRLFVLHQLGFEDLVENGLVGAFLGILGAEFVFGR